ncbi:MAG TPA: EAL domain-containing protein, partial [Bacillota bacterium]|nr:EAL domain-containing protein [Bacillota bacterium]
SGLIMPIGEWVLEEACRQNKIWQDQGYPPFSVNVNISVRQFQRGDFLETVKGVLNRTGLEPRFLELEITETVAMQDVEYTVHVLDRLKQKSIKVAIDDFGTGYSSLSYLKRFPINTLKIDRSFVSDISGDSDETSIVSTIIVLARNLELKVVAEGVETEEQLNFLRRHRCGFAQGFLFSTPQPGGELTSLLQKYAIKKD